MSKQESLPEIASTREFWILEPKNPKEQKPYPTCYRREPTWGCEPLPKDDPFNEVIHVREVIKNAPTASPTTLSVVLKEILPTLESACEYAKHKDMMNSAWHRKPVQHRELTLDLIAAVDKVRLTLEGNDHE